MKSDLSYLGEVTDMPRRRKPGEISFIMTLNIPGQPKVACRAIDLPWRPASKVEKGDTVIFKANFRAIDAKLSPFSYNNTLLRRGIYASCKILYLTIIEKSPVELQEKVSSYLQDSVHNLSGNNESSGLFLSMALGQRDAISEETEEAYKKTGLAHLLVLSGYQITLIFASLVFIFSYLLLQIPRSYLYLRIDLIAFLFSFILAVFFVLVCGVEGSSLRAIVASSVAVISYSFERGGGFLNSILISILVLSLIWPGSYLEPGLQLTYMALFGICLGGYLGASKLGQYLYVCLCVSLLTSLIVCLWFEGFSFSGFFLNPIFAPLFSLLSCNLGFLALVAYLTGLDSSGIFLGGIIYWISSLNEIILDLARQDFFYIELLRPYNIIFAIICGALILKIINDALYKYLLERNLFDSVK